jgi:molybdopterin synthase sulfur carrier subunit
MAEVHLPRTLLPLFAGLERTVQVDADSVGGAFDALDARFPGLRDRLCEPGPVLRRHIVVFVEQQRVGLDAPVSERTRVDVIAAITGG